MRHTGSRFERSDECARYGDAVAWGIRSDLTALSVSSRPWNTGSACRSEPRLCDAVCRSTVSTSVRASGFTLDQANHRKSADPYAVGHFVVKAPRSADARCKPACRNTTFILTRYLKMPNFNSSNPCPTCKKGGGKMMKCDTCGDIRCSMGGCSKGGAKSRCPVCRKGKRQWV